MAKINNQYTSLESFKSSNNVKTKVTIAQKVEPSTKVQVAQNDPFMKWPLRGMAYTNEIGECIRPMSGMLANLSWIPVFAYVGADVADKYKHGADGADNPSKKRALKQLSFQALASMALPTIAVKGGQAIANGLGLLGKTKMSFHDREKVTDSIIESLDKGSHKKFIDKNTGLVNREAYVQHIVDNFKTKGDHLDAGKKGFTLFKKIGHALKRPFKIDVNSEHFRAYIANTVDDVMNMRKSLLEGKRPENVSKKLFKTFSEDLKGTQKAKEGAVFNIIRKVQKNKIMKNNALKSLGGFIALGVMMKPIDNFVENVLIERYISPTINVLGSKKFWKSLSETAKNVHNETKNS